MPRIQRHRELQVWSAADVTAFLQHIAEDRLAAIYVLAATTGMRRGELLGLRWQDVDLESEPPRLQVRRSLVQYGQTIIEKEPKTSRSRRSIALDPAAVAALRRHRIQQAEERLAAGAAYEPGGPVFSDQLGRPLRPAAISAAFQRQVKAARLPKLTLHGLRHTFATMGLELGVDTLYISEILGHSSPAITQAVYQHTREERLTSAVRQVGDAIFGASR